MIDCLLIGYNEMNFEQYESTIRKMGTNSAAYRDLNKNFIKYNNELLTVADSFNTLIRNEPSSKHQYKELVNGDIFSCAIAYLSTYLHRGGFTFDYINSFQEEKDLLAQKLQNDEILTIGITTTLYTIAIPIIEIVEFIRRYNKKAKIIIGGPYILNQIKSLDPDTLQNLLVSLGADFYIDNTQGEEALCRIIGELKNGIAFNSVKNIYYRDGDRYISTPKEREENKLEDNMIKWELFPDKVGQYVSLRTSTSCPFSCSYCGFPENAGKYQTIDVSSIENELNVLDKIGTIKSISFFDDTFNIPVKRFKEILKMIIRNKYTFKWHSFFRCQYADEETVKLMKESGCEGVFLGLESANNVILENMNKQAKVEDYYRGIELLKKYGITTFGSFIVGFPGETYDTFEDTKKFIEQSAIDFYRAQLWYCDPVTPIFRQKEKYGIIGERFEWKHNTMDSRTASNLIDEMFINVNKSIWVPQHNFDFTNIWRLTHCGLNLDGVKRYLNAFNSAIKEKLQNPEFNEASNSIIKGIKQSCIENLDCEFTPLNSTEDSFDFS